MRYASTSMEQKVIHVREPRLLRQIGFQLIEICLGYKFNRRREIQQVINRINSND